MEQERPKVGIGVIVVRDGKILIGERIYGHGDNTYMIAGGHLEFGESFEECAMREAKEETGLNVEVKGIVSISSKVDYGKHYVSVGILTESKSGDPYSAEPDKATNWKWYEPKDLPENIFLPSKRVLKNYLAGTMYSDNQ